MRINSNSRVWVADPSRVLPKASGLRELRFDARSKPTRETRALPNPNWRLLRPSVKRLARRQRSSKKSGCSRIICARSIETGFRSRRFILPAELSRRVIVARYKWEARSFERVEIFSRDLRRMTEQFPELAEQGRLFEAELILDGE